MGLGVGEVTTVRPLFLLPGLQKVVPTSLPLVAHPSPTFWTSQGFGVVFTVPQISLSFRLLPLSVAWHRPWPPQNL